MKMTDERLAELDAVMAKATAAFPITSRDTADYAEITFGSSQTQAMSMEPATLLAINDVFAAIPDIRAHIDAQAATIARAIAIIEHCDVTEGVCCCGDDMTTHPEPISCGHSPVDQGSYAASQWLEEARAALTGAA